jgi:hypothetical protein
MPAAPSLSADQITALISDLSHQPATDQKGTGEEVFRSVDFNKQYGAEENVVSYALCRFTADRARTLTLLADGDDGVRVWVNGQIAVSQPGPGVIPPDSAKASVTLQPGENTILVESEQAGGGWGFSLRLLDETGKPFIPSTTE